MKKSNHPFPAVPLKEIWVRGTPREIGRQHAEAVEGTIQQGMPRFYYEFWQRMAHPANADLSKRIGMGLAWKFLETVIVRKMHRQVPDWALDRVKGLCEVSGRDLREMTTALILPDLFPLFEVWAAKWYPQLFVEVEFPPLFGCSSFFSRGERFLFGRNLDFPGVSYWDRFPVIQVTEPKNSLRYIAFSSAGVPFGGITGVNEAQISVALHQHYSSAGSLGGKLPFLIAEQVLMEARTLAEAQEIIGRHPVATSWAFLVGDGKAKEAMIFECHAKASKVNWLIGNHLAHSNFYQTPDCRRDEFATSTRMNWDNYCRKNRLDQLLAEAGSELSAERAVQILSDHYDPYWEEEKPFNRTVSQVYNIQSILFDLENMKVYMAEGDSPIHLGRYVPYDLGKLFSGHSGRGEASLLGYQFSSATKRSAKEKFILSFVKAFDGDFLSAERDLDASLADDYVPEAALIQGVLKLKRNQFAEAALVFDKARAFIEKKKNDKGKDEFPPEYFEILIYLARSYDLLRRFADAERIYDLILNSPSAKDSNLRRIAKNRIRYEPRHLDKILMPYSSYIPFQ